MSTGMDLHALSDRQRAAITSREAVERLGMPDVVLWGFTQAEIDALAEWLEVSKPAHEPLPIDSAAGEPVVVWTTAFSHALAGLTGEQVHEFAKRLKASDALEHLELDTIVENLQQLAEICTEALRSGRTILQVS